MTSNEIVEAVYGHFHSAGCWPSVRLLQVRYRPYGNFRTLAARLGRDIINCQDGDDGTCSLTLQAMAELPAAKADIDLFLAALDVIATIYEGKGPKLITSAEINGHLGATTVALRRLGALLYQAPLWKSGTWPDSHDFSITPREEVLFLGELHSFREYQERRASIDREALERSTLLMPEVWRAASSINSDVRNDDEGSPAAVGMPLSGAEINRICTQWIGVDGGGYLGDFSYQSHHDFYAELNLTIDPSELKGTTRQRFTAILKRSPPDIQARILEGILTRFPLGSSPLRTVDRHAEMEALLHRLRMLPAVALPTPRTSSVAVARALADAERLLGTQGAASAVDRVHTALHGFLIEACQGGGIAVDTQMSLPKLLRLLREQHPRLRGDGLRGDEVLRVLRAHGAALDALNSLRNARSLAHPNESLLAEPEAMLVINTARTLLHYLDAKLRLSGVQAEIEK